MTDRLVLIESNTTGTGRLFITAARRLGLEPALVTDDPSRYAYVAEEGVEVVRQSSVGDLDAVSERIDRLAADSPIAGIYSSSEYFIETAAVLAARRGLPGPDPQAVRACRDKGRQRQLLQDAGVAVPRFLLARTVREALAALADLPPPVVVKPTQGTGSAGVRLCYTGADVEAHATRLLSNRTNERGIAVPPEILIEEYVSWEEFSAEFLGLSLLGITRKHVSPPPYFVEIGHDFPVVLDEAGMDRVPRALCDALRAVGICWGPTHVEFRYAAGRYAIMEINPRLAGGYIPELVRVATGVDPIEATVALATGRVPDLTRTAHGSASIRFICPGSEGTIVGVRGIDEAARLDGIAEIRMYRPPDYHHVIHHDFRDRVGHVLARGGDEQAARASAALAETLIEVQLQCLS